jgi:hypothetical protein
LTVMDTFMEAPFSRDAGSSKHIKRLQCVSVGTMQSKLAVARNGSGTDVS